MPRFIYSSKKKNVLDGDDDDRNWFAAVHCICGPKPSHVRITRKPPSRMEPQSISVNLLSVAIATPLPALIFSLLRQHYNWSHRYSFVHVEELARAIPAAVCCRVYFSRLFFAPRCWRQQRRCIIHWPDIGSEPNLQLILSVSFRWSVRCRRQAVKSY